MKYALCCKSYNDLISFVLDKNYNIEHEFVFLPRYICEDSKNCYHVQIIPTVTIVNINSDAFKIIVYTRSNRISEERLVDKKSCTIGGHIDSLEDINLIYINEENLRQAKPFNMTKSNFNKVLDNCRKRELIEEVGEDVCDFLSEHSSTMTEVIYSKDTDVSRLHIGFNKIYKLNSNDFDTIFSKFSIDKSEIASVNVYELEFNYFRNLIKENESKDYKDKIISNLKDILEESNFEDWSIKTISSLFSRNL